MTRGMNNGRKLKIRRYADLVKDNQRLEKKVKSLTEATPEMCAEGMRVWDERMNQDRQSWPDMLKAVYEAMAAKAEEGE
jgi:hypothetical protein